MSLETNISSLATRIATELKVHKNLINGNAGDLSALQTTAKNNLVAAINELVGAIGGAGASIDDGVVSTLTVWSSDKTDAEIDARVAALVDGAPEVLDTLTELAAALGDDPNFAATVANQLASKAPLASPTFTGTVTVPNGAFTIAKTAGLQAALDGKITAFTNPGADRIVFWDNSATAFAGLALSGLTISGTTMSPTAATETATGVAERATLAEVGAGTDTTRFVTPAGVRQEINTHTHTAAQISDATTIGRSILLANDAAAVRNAIGAAGEPPAASQTVAGVIEIATNAEVASGADAVRAVTPAGLRHVTGDVETSLVAVFEAALA